MKRIGTIIMSLGLLTGLFNGAFAAAIAPSIVGYQGRLTDASDVALTGTYSITFKLYDAPSGGTLLWQETHSAVSVQNGIFSAVLGQGSSPVPLNETHFAQSNRYLAIVIGAVEVSPRTQMTSVPFSQRVMTVDLARGGIISGQIELQADASKDGEATSAALIVRGTNLSRLVAIRPDLDIALSATSNDGNEVLRLDALETGGAMKVNGATNNTVAAMSATTNGGNVSVSAVNGDVAAQLSSSPTGGTVAVYEPSAKGDRLSQKKWELTPEALIEFGSTANESLIVMRQSAAGIGQILVADYTNPTPATVSIGNGTALSMKNSSGQTVVNVDEVGASFSGNLTVEWSLAKAPGENFTLLGTGNICDWDLPSNPDAHAENVFVVGQDNTVQSKDVFILGTNNQIRDDSDPSLNGNRSAVIGLNNIVYGDDSFCFGKNNYIGATSSAAFGQRNYVNGSNNNFAFGDSNLVTATGNASILGGNFNLLTFSPNSAIAGGIAQTLNLSGYSFVGAGYGNNITGTDEPTDRYNAIGGGYSNDITSAGYATVAGGRENVASGDASTIAGGRFNTVSGAGATVIGGTGGDASGNNSTVLGGYNSVASGIGAIAAGHAANATHDGSCVISAYTSAFPLEKIFSGGVNQMVLRAPGGLFITNATSASSATYNTSRLINTPASVGAYLTTTGVWTDASDRDLKENFESVDIEEVLAKLVQLPITEWNYKGDSDEFKHIGPMAQDFYALFSVGYDNKSLSSIDRSGVAFAAIQALYKKTEELKATTSKLKNQEDELAKMKEQLAQMQALLNKLAESKN